MDPLLSTHPAPGETFVPVTNASVIETGFSSRALGSAPCARSAFTAFSCDVAAAMCSGA